MTQNGKVISVEGEKAKVVVMRRSACEGCKQKNLCAGVSDGCADGKPVEAVVKNTVGASSAICFKISIKETIINILFCFGFF